MTFVGDNELVLPMPPISMRRIEVLADAVLDVLAPAMTGPTGYAVNVADLIERVLPEHGVDVYPVTAGELGPRFAATRADGDRTLIRLRDELWDNILAGGRRANHARATVFHETGHAVMHVKILRQWGSASSAEVELNRSLRRNLRAFEDPEWQAWGLGGCLAAPRRLLARLLPTTLGCLASEFQVSEDFLRRHVRRLRLGDQVYDLTSRPIGFV